MSKPKPAAIFDHCQHCGVTTVWQYRVDNQDTGAEGGITGVRTASVAASRPMKLPNVSPRLSPILTIMNRNRRSIVEMDRRPVIGRVGTDSWRPRSPTVGWPPSRHWGCRVTPVRAGCEGNWSRQTSQFSGSFGNGDDLADGEAMGAHSSGRE